MDSSPITSRQIEGEKVEAVTDFLFLGSKITADGDCMKLEDDCFLQESSDKQCVKNQRYHFVDTIFNFIKHKSSFWYCVYLMLILS